MGEHTPARGGRPRKADHEARNNFIGARYRHDEYATVERRAAQADRTLSDFVRAMTLHGQIVVKNTGGGMSERDRHDMARIGSNLNQIARSLNMNPDLVDPRQARRLTDELTSLLADLRALLERLYELE